MSCEDAVLKCRDCGSVYPLAYTEAAHRERDHCDGALGTYCMSCKSFFDGSSCIECGKSHAEDTESRLRRRQQAIARWRTFPGISQIDWFVRRSPVCRRILDDWEYHAGLQAFDRQLCVCLSVGVFAGILTPAFLKVPVLACVAVFGIYVSSLKRLPSI